jgi:predicted ester cyclase
MQLQENKTLVRRLIDEAQNHGKLDVIDDLLADNFVDHTPLPGLPPTREGVRILFGTLRAAFPDLHVVISEQIAEDERVVTRKTFQGTHGGEFLGFAPTGNPVAFEVIDILTIRDRRITEHRVVFDQLGLLRQLGAPV